MRKYPFTSCPTDNLSKVKRNLFLGQLPPSRMSLENSLTCSYNKHFGFYLIFLHVFHRHSRNNCPSPPTPLTAETFCHFPLLFAPEDIITRTNNEGESPQQGHTNSNNIHTGVLTHPHSIQNYKKSWVFIYTIHSPLQIRTQTF